MKVNYALNCWQRGGSFQPGSRIWSHRAATVCLARQRRLQYLERALQSPIEAYDRSAIAVSLTVIWGTEDCHERLASKEFVTLLCHLVCTAYDINFKFFAKLVDNIRPETIRYPPVLIQRVARRVLLWVRPQEVAQQPIFWNFNWATNPSNLIEGPQGWGEASVDAEYFVVDKRGDRHAIEGPIHQPP
eukprot:CAMPEP_0114495402 /NCGR_PEP_ID=MMETSP0109-20121206/5193_1 /TAXON_ID=29199 /ORGANISM="Chlorarachnion reptans, Strain CCCM449" /LENGTH=187 /DNA_ID=CAMNT_0001672557 /DNA_START=199 /DNA_END=762 /DNA_ORIENTATION=-